MTPVQDVALGLLDIIERLLLAAEARQAVLDHLELEGDDYTDLVEKAEILSAAKVHEVVERLRDGVRSNPEPRGLPQDVDSVVRRILKQVQ